MVTNPRMSLGRTRQRIDASSTPTRTRLAPAGVDKAPAALLLALALALVAAGCATAPVNPLPPDVTLDGVRITRFTPFETRLAVALVVHNRNPYDLAVSEIDASVAIDGDRLLTGSLPAAVTLAANADTPVEIEMRTDYAAIVAALDRLARQREIHYEVLGSATVQGGVRLRFERRGELPAARWFAPAR